MVVAVVVVVVVVVVITSVAYTFLVKMFIII